MRDKAGLAAVLRRVAQLLAGDDVDTSWSSYEADELRNEVSHLLARAESGPPLGEAE